MKLSPSLSNYIYCEPLTIEILNRFSAQESIKMVKAYYIEMFSIVSSKHLKSKVFAVCTKDL